MSRIGKSPVIIPEGVKVNLDKNRVSVQGPKGSITKNFHSSMKVDLEDSKIVVTRFSDNKFYKALHGMTRALIANMIKGVTAGFSKSLEIVGVGYKAEVVGKNLQLALGFSHPILLSPPEGIKIEAAVGTKITVSGVDKELVGQVAAKIRSLRPPEPYKGKGIRYQNEKVRKKAGKTAA
ncbi:MAG: 50S ribosomal protein L6 [candidate division Zixibacteria bacterium RBG_16_40_9]|nr:MAG: 50S ribosomal protein L6 [candidate division Zixibacteria bacterium RBG_16_40_9]